MTTIAERLLLLRGSTKQGEFARLLGINPNTLRSYENGRSLPNQDILERICVQFSVSPSWLLLGQGAMKVSDEAVEVSPQTGFHQEEVTATPLETKLSRLEQELDEERQERRILSKENMRLYQENSALLRENGTLKERIALIEDRGKRAEASSACLGVVDGQKQSGFSDGHSRSQRVVTR